MSSKNRVNKLNSGAKSKYQPYQALAVMAIVGLVGSIALFVRAATIKTPLMGVITPSNGKNLAEVDTFANDAGSRPDIYGYYAEWAWNNFDPTVANAIVAKGMTPEIAWMSMNSSKPTDQQPEWALSTIISGSHDAYIKNFATAVKKWGKPLRLRLDPEMNSTTYPWGVNVYGQTPQQYVAAWQHVNAIFKRAKATNVIWVWAPSNCQDGNATCQSLYPGDNYVSVLGSDGYNWGSSVSWSAWRSFDQVFGQTLAIYKAMAPTKPISISETASAEVGGDKAAWISDMFNYLKLHPEIKSFTWFNYNKETDWRIESSAAAQQAFKAGVLAR